MTIHKKKERSVGRWKLLELAHFLTRFQDHYLTSNERNNNEGNDDSDSHDKISGRFLIKVSDLMTLFEYRKLLAKRDRKEDVWFAAKESCKRSEPAQAINRLKANRLEQEIAGLNSKINSFSGRTKRIHCLQLRFEVWSTKILAQKDFVASCDTLTLGEETKKSTFSHFSPHLNIPCSDHFCEILPGVPCDEWSIPNFPSTIHNMPESECTLPLVPNKHTWKEFARISRILSLLDKESRVEIYKRRSCIFDIKCKNSYKDLYTQNYNFQPEDLMALWVRSQRDSHAMRHLYCLFEIKRRNETNEEEGTQNQANGPLPAISVVYSGNPTCARQRICETSPLVDELVEWAVTNQSLFSYHHVHSHILSSFLKRKRKRNNEEETTTRQRKRARQDGDQDDGDLERLRYASYSFVLRWFGRRHRKLTSVIFSKKQKILHLDIGCRESDRNNANLLHEKVDTGISDYMSKPEIDGLIAFSKDRTLARIDRRMHNYGNQITLSSQVQTLLDALDSAGQSYGVRKDLIQAAKSDFKRFYRYFFEEPNDLLEAASMLVDTNLESIRSTADLLNSVPSPWKQHCAYCDQPAADHNKLRTCACCEATFHEACTSWKQNSLAGIISTFPPLHDICAIKLPINQPHPDFREGSRVVWKEIELSMRRQVDGETLGLSLTQTSASNNIYNKLVNGTVLDLANLIAYDKRKRKVSTPMALNFDGFLICGVSDGDFAGNRAGLRKGDVIQHLEIVEFFPGVDATRTSFNFQNISAVVLKEVFPSNAALFKLCILRPSIDVVQASRDWYELVKVQNKALTAAMNDVGTEEICTTIWHCGNCEDRAQGQQQQRRSKKEEAEFCRAVVRRISMESYASPFEAEYTDDPVISLRRLDSMMSYIIDRQSSSCDRNNWMSRAFWNPPWGVEGGRHVAWAVGLEDKPMELLCKGFHTIIKSALVSTKNESRNSSNVTALFRHFLSAFVSWCVLACSESRRTIGPPPIFRLMKPAWILPSCTMCIGRPITGLQGKVCNHRACCALAKSDAFQVSDFAKDEVTEVTRSIKEYVERSALVGTTLLVHHDDPLVESVSKVVKVDHDNRPVEFIIASYLPKEFRDAIFNRNQTRYGDKCSDSDGIFHLLPVVQARQQKYLLDRLKTRQRSIKNMKDEISWVTLKALDLAGVARYSFSEVKKKLFDSIQIRLAVEATIVRQCMVPPGSNGAFNDNESRPSRFELFEYIIAQTDPMASMNCLNTLASHLLSEGKLNSGENTSESASRSTPSSEWNIVAREGDNERQVTFGTSVPLPRLLPINCAPESNFNVLEPETDECILVYSDLHFGNDEDKVNLRRQVHPKELDTPSEGRPYNGKVRYSGLTILLTKHGLEYDSAYQGIGWGFELVRWRHENFFRVGRICSQSPAQHSGLQTNDIISLVAGRKINSFDSANLIASILGASEVRVQREDSTSQSNISVILGIIATSKCDLDPVVLKIYRLLQVSEHQRAGSTQRTRLSQRVSESSNNTDDEIIVLGTKNCSNQQSTVLQLASHNPTRLSRIPNFSPVESKTSVASNAMPYPNSNVACRYNSQAFEQNVKSMMQSLFLRTRHIGGRRRPLSIDQLYSPAKNGVMFTMAEAGLYLECLLRLQPMLGIRLLCPRYSVRAIVDQLKVMKDWSYQNIQKVPSLTDVMFHALMSLDYRRATNEAVPEQGEIKFRERNPNHDPSRGETVEYFEYRIPINRLPVDRCLERLLAAKQQAMPQQMHYNQQLNDSGYGSFDHNQPHQQNTLPQNEMESNHQPYPQHVPPQNGSEPSPLQYQTHDNIDAQNADTYLRRIRGGGTSINDQVQDETLLSDTPVERWHGLPVYMMVNPKELEGEEEKMLVGFVKPSPDIDLVSEMEIDVEGHYLEDLGEFEDPVLVSAASNQIIVIDMKTSVAGYAAHAASIIRELYAQKKGPEADNANCSNDVNQISQEQECREQKALVEDVHSTPNCHSGAVNNSVVPYENDTIRIQVPQGKNLTNSQQEEDRLTAATSGTTTIFKNETKMTSLELLASRDKLRSQMNYFGDLPDGRQCFWSVSDPGALYITTDELDDNKAIEICQNQYSSFLVSGVEQLRKECPQLVRRHLDRFHCPWGCSIADENASSGNECREALSFVSQANLVNHCKDCFTFGDRSSFIDIGRSTQCLRVSDGQMICNLYCDLSSALYARSFGILDFAVWEELPTKTCSTGAHFVQSPTGRRLLLIINDVLHLKTEHIQKTLDAPESRTICDLIALLENISCLFEVQKTGKLRFSDEDLLKACFIFDKSTPRENNAPNAYGRPKSKKRLPGGSLCTACVGCDLCTLPWEKTLPMQESTTGNDAMNRFTGSGCCLINNLIRRNEPKDGYPGSLGEAKLLLLEIGNIVPEQLKLHGKKNEFDPLSNCRLWEGNSFDVWRQFVTYSTDVKQLKQAYVTLLASIRKKLLPSWWRTDGAGWSTSQVILVNERLSSLLLHVYVLDAAIAEYTCQKIYKKTMDPLLPSTASAPSRSVQRKIAGTANERMNKYMKVAKSLEYERYEGKHGSECVMCKDGGDLLCCDLCSNVQHVTCCTPCIEGDGSDLDTFICDVCINDIEAIME